MNFQEILAGTGVAIVTPFDDNEAVDYPALGKLIDHIIEGGCEYIVTLGTTGETPVLSREEKLAIIDFTFAHINGRVPVVVGVGGNNTAEVVKDLESFPLDKAIAVLSASPYYNKPSSEGIFQHYKALAAASPKPVILYNVPGRTGKNMDAALTLRIANEIDNIAGIKEASGDMSQCMEILRNRPAGFSVVSGDDALALPQIACGMDGVISVAANSFPRKFSDMVRASLQNDFATARTLNDSLIDAYQLMFAENNPAGVKAILAELDIIKNVVRLPVVTLSGALHQRVKDYLNRGE